MGIYLESARRVDKFFKKVLKNEQIWKKIPTKFFFPGIGTLTDCTCPTLVEDKTYTRSQTYQLTYNIEQISLDFKFLFSSFISEKFYYLICGNHFFLKM